MKQNNVSFTQLDFFIPASAVFLGGTFTILMSWWKVPSQSLIHIFALGMILLTPAIVFISLKQLMHFSNDERKKFNRAKNKQAA